MTGVLIPAPEFTGAALIGRRCNPYGAESGGPQRVLGGLHGPRSAENPPDAMPGLPDSVAQGEWVCPQLAVVRCRMICGCGHQGGVMELCSWHDETVYGAEFVAGTSRVTTKTVRSMGHYEMIGRRQAGACPRCLFPGQYAEWYKALQVRQEELALLRDRGMWYSSRAVHVRSVIEDIVAQFDAGQQAAGGPIHRCAMKLVPVS